MPDSSEVRHESFHWSECHTRLQLLNQSNRLTLEPKGRFFLASGVKVFVPGVVPLLGPELGTLPGLSGAAEEVVRSVPSWREKTTSANGIEDYLATIPSSLPRHVVMLVQAGAVSLGYFESGQALATKTFKRYVVRGKGRAQPTYLAEKGKSRFGSRLRLRNARLLFEESNEKLIEWWHEFGEPALILVSVPKRLWPDLLLAKPQPPFGKHALIVRIPLDLPVPKTELLLRTYKAMGYGRIEWGI